MSHSSAPVVEVQTIYEDMFLVFISPLTESDNIIVKPKDKHKFIYGTYWHFFVYVGQMVTYQK